MNSYSAVRRRIFGRLAPVVTAWLAAVLPFGGAAFAGAPELMTLNDVGRGQLLFNTVNHGRYVPAPLLGTSVEIQVSGVVARIRVRQKFINPSNSWLEGKYAFPLPENAAVDRMRLTVGDQVIVASIKEREEARKTYERARREGRRAALVEQQRPNLFTNSVANIGPKQTVTVEIRYQQSLRYDQGRFSLRFPMVVAPRFVPGSQRMVGVSALPGEPPLAETSPAEIADARVITSPVLHPDMGKINPVVLRVRLDAGVALSRVESPYHKISVTRRGTGQRAVTLAGGPVPADRDFQLVWTPRPEAAPRTAVFQERVDGDTYLLVVMLPGNEDRSRRLKTPRDAVFILDRSGSMGGESIRQARKALTLALERLHPGDRFNVVRFDNRTDSLFDDLRPATALNVGRAVGYVQGTEARGGTVMRPALRLALAGDRMAGRLRQVVFLTDGAVSNERQLLHDIGERLNGSRLFTVGIGSAPNSYFMRKAAEAGRGTFTYIGKLSEVQTRVGELLVKLERPALTDIATSWRSSTGRPMTVAAYPGIAPDLYQGEPVILAVRLGKGERLGDGASLTLDGRIDGRPWRRQIALTGALPAAGISAIWARAKIEDLTDSLRRGASHDAVRRAMIETAMRHSLVSRYTSLVAVSETVARPPGENLVSRKLPHNLPEGWNYETTFGDVLRKANPIRQRDASNSGRSQHTAVRLPQGATPAVRNLLLGLLALLAAAGMLVFLRRTA